MRIRRVVDLLHCPVCQGRLSHASAGLACTAGHSFDVARQGFVTLSRTGIRHPGDSAQMVMARERIQSAGLLDAIRDQICRAVPDGVRTMLDLGAGTGFYAAAVVEGHAGRRGVALDSSKPALKRAARAHPRLGAVGADLTEPLPVRSDVIDCCLIAFAPRNVAEILRVLTDDGLVVVVVPGPEHLQELINPLGMLSVPDGKQDEIRARLGVDVEVQSVDRLHTTVEVSRAQAVDLAGMGPAGFHQTADHLATVAAQRLSPTSQVTVSVDTTVLAKTSRGEDH